MLRDTLARMLLHHIVILALIQGITEFLPVSSSGHLILAHAGLEGKVVSDWANDQVMDVAVHVGTLLAVLVYFHRDVRRMALAPPPLKRPQGKWCRLRALVIVASLPVIVAGLGLHLWQPGWLRSVEIVGWTTLLFGILLGLADKFAPADKDLGQLSYKNAILIGLTQILALIPGTSRSGITMTAGRAIGLNRVEAARFSLLMGVVAIAGAGALSAYDLYLRDSWMLTSSALIGAVLAFASALISIAVMMRWLEKSGFMPFVIYRIALGALLLAGVYGGIF